MKILLFGPNGQVGYELSRSLSIIGEIILCPRSLVDLNSDLTRLDAFIREINPDIIVNAAAYTHVDLAEKNETIAQRINHEAPDIMAQAAAAIGCWFIHYSTDYVFDGNKLSPYVEEDPTTPVNIYGKTKADGESAIRETGCKHLILRTSWIYSARGRNFINTVLNIARKSTQMSIVNDQVGAPTSAEMIADITALIVYRLISDPSMKEFTGGTYHLTASGETSWHGFASYIVQATYKIGETLKTTPENVHKITTEQYPTPAKRPANSRLNTQKICNDFQIILPEWQLHVDRILIELQTTGVS